MKANSTLTMDIQEKIDHLATGIAEEIVHQIPPNSLITESQRSDLIKNEIFEVYSQFFEKLQDGLREISENRPKIESTAIDDTDTHTNLELIQLWEAFDKIKELEITGQYPKDYCGLNDSIMKSFNSVAAYLYEGKQFKKSAAVYTLLTYLDPRQPAFWLGLGNSEYFNQSYQAAIQAYQMAMAVNPNDVQAYFYSAHCHQNLGNTDLAMQSVNQAMEIIKNNPLLKQWKKPAEDLKAFLTKVALKR